MSTGPLQIAIKAEHLTDALRRSGALGDGRVCNVVVESSRSTLLSQIIRLRLTYDGAASHAPNSIILKTALPDRIGGLSNAGRQEVAFYTQVAAVMSAHLVPRCFEAVWDKGMAPPARRPHRFARDRDYLATSADDGAV
jgi:hypothetical protein